MGEHLKKELLYAVISLVLSLSDHCCCMYPLRHVQYTGNLPIRRTGMRTSHTTQICPILESIPPTDFYPSQPSPTPPPHLSLHLLVLSSDAPAGTPFGVAPPEPQFLRYSIVFELQHDTISMRARAR